MDAKFNFTEAVEARRPVIVLIGHVVEGSITVGDRISVPLVDGSRFVAPVVEISRFRQVFTTLRAGQEEEPVGVALSRPSPHQASDIEPGLATIP